MLPYENIIAMEAIKRLMNAGYYVTVDYDRGYEASDMRNCNRLSDMSAILLAMDAVDECWLMVNKEPMTFDCNGNTQEPYDAGVRFIWSNGNQGCDCISDYDDSLCAHLDDLGENWAYVQFDKPIAALQSPIDSGTVYVYHRGTDTYIAVDECELINVPDDIPGDEIEEYLSESEGERLVDRLKGYNQ